MTGSTVNMYIHAAAAGTVKGTETDTDAAGVTDMSTARGTDAAAGTATVKDAAIKANNRSSEYARLTSTRHVACTCFHIGGPSGPV